MSNRNEDRLGLGLPTPSKDAAEPLDLAEKAMSLDFPAPTEFVDLPSKGKLYPQGHPLSGKESVEINFMTTKDEDILSSKLLLKKGKAIDKFIDHILVDKKIKSHDLLIGDKNAILIAARISGYGNIYEAGIVCEHCGEKFKHNFDLNKIVPVEGAIPEGETDIQKTPNNSFLVKLKKSKWVAEIRPLFGKDEEVLFSMMETAKKNKKEETSLSDQLKLIISSIKVGNTIYTDPASLEKAVCSMPAGDAKQIRNAYSEVFPKLDATKEIVCPECEKTQEVDMPIDVGFFWSK